MLGTPLLGTGDRANQIPVFIDLRLSWKDSNDPVNTWLSKSTGTGNLEIKKAKSEDESPSSALKGLGSWPWLEAEQLFPCLFLARALI